MNNEGCGKFTKLTFACKRTIMQIHLIFFRFFYSGVVIPPLALFITHLMAGREQENDKFVPGHAFVRIRTVRILDNTVDPCYIVCKIPYDHLLDCDHPLMMQMMANESPQQLDEYALQVMKVGQRINTKGLLLTEPYRAVLEFLQTGKHAVVTCRPQLVRVAEEIESDHEDSDVNTSMELDSLANDNDEVSESGTDEDAKQGKVRLEGLVAILPM
jgi:hypothetical protein